MATVWYNMSDDGLKEGSGSDEPGSTIAHAQRAIPLRYRDPLTGKWVRARYVAELAVIAARYREWEITGLNRAAVGAPQRWSCRPVFASRQQTVS